MYSEDVYFLNAKVRFILSTKVTGVEAPDLFLVAEPMSVKSAKLLSPKLKLREMPLELVGEEHLLEEPASTSE